MKKSIAQIPFTRLLTTLEGDKKPVRYYSHFGRFDKHIGVLSLLIASFATSYSQTTTSSGPIIANGNYVVPAGITKVDVECWGGGGGGGGANGSSTATTERGGGGGAGGSFTRATGVTVAPGNVACTIGAGGITELPVCAAMTYCNNVFSLLV
ncbi:MAG: hypothetical protein AB7K37_13785 [Cyclobacteriaceae bacterium]